MPEFLQLVRLELYTFLTRKELNTFQAVCSQWKWDISHRSHLLAVNFPGQLQIEVVEAGVNAEPFIFERSAHVSGILDQLDCLDSARKLVGERFIPCEDRDMAVSITYFPELSHISEFHLYVWNELTEEASVALLRVFSRLHGKCLGNILLCSCIVNEQDPRIFNPLFYEVLSERVGVKYSLHFLNGCFYPLELISMGDTLEQAIKISTIHLYFYEQEKAEWLNNVSRMKNLFGFITSRRCACMQIVIHVDCKMEKKTLQSIVQVSSL